MSVKKKDSWSVNRGTLVSVRKKGLLYIKKKNSVKKAGTPLVCDVSNRAADRKSFTMPQSEL